MSWYYCPHTSGWWIVRSNGPVMHKLYGPFSAQEAGLAATVHDVPFFG